jgi:hypothetical protein
MATKDKKPKNEALEWLNQGGCNPCRNTADMFKPPAPPPPPPTPEQIQQLKEWNAKLKGKK